MSSTTGRTTAAHRLARREFLALVAGAPAVTAWLSHGAIAAATFRRPARFLFTSRGKTGVADVDGSGVRYFELDVPNQVTWQPAAVFPDGQRIVMLSMEPRRDGPGKPFDEYYTQTPTHLWIYHLDSGKLEEICDQDRLAPFVTPALLIGDDRLLVQVVKNRVGQIYSVRLDGSDAREFTKAGEGLPYGFSASPDGKQIAFHIAGPEGYQVFVSDALGANRVKIAGDARHLYFGPTFSPDGQLLAFADCKYHGEPAHDWADVCVAPADGSAPHRVLTEGGAMWFGATYGSPKTRGGGSNIVAWTRDGAILFPRRTKDAKVPWEYNPNRPDVDHFNRDFKPELARGGTEVCRMNPQDGSVTLLTKSDPPVWDFRASTSPDGKHLVFCRAATGEAPAIWVADSDGRNARPITQGIDDLGADHPRWL
jgi:TolB protein